MLPMVELIKPSILEMIERRDWHTLQESLADWPSPEVADLLLGLPKADRVLFYRALPRPQAADAFSHLEPQQQDELLRDLTDEETRHLLEELSPDDRTHLLTELPSQVTQAMVNLLAPRELREVRWLLGYPEDSVGRLMTPDYVAVRAHWTVAQALRQVRRRGQDSETISRIYVVDDDWVLIDDIELRKLILAEPETSVSEVMDHSFVSVSAFESGEEAVRLVRRYDLTALPVLDSAGVIVGIVTVDDLLDVAEEEATEDFHKVGSVGPIRTSLREAPASMLYQRRIGWLMTLVFVNILSGAGMALFEETIAATVALTYFLPALIGSGGNAGSQSATMMVRALATGDVRMGDWFRLFGKEFGVALLLGLTMAAGLGGIAVIRNPAVAVVVSLSMVIIVLVGSLVGMTMPFLLTRLGRDPAIASTPLITSIADISGVLIYFSIASWYLGSG
jgi:magnesium transporter